MGCLSLTLIHKPQNFLNQIKPKPLIPITIRSLKLHMLDNLAKSVNLFQLKSVIRKENLWKQQCRKQQSNSLNFTLITNSQNPPNCLMREIMKFKIRKSFIVYAKFPTDETHLNCCCRTISPLSLEMLKLILQLMEDNT